jgi:methyl-accepting chemotaxis protein
MSENAARITEGDLSATIEVHGRGDETAQLGMAINALSRGLKDMLGRLRQTGQSVTEAISVITAATKKISNGARVQQEATEQTAMTVQEMAASIKGVAESAAEMSDVATDASSSVTEMAASIEEVAKNASVLAAATEETASSIDQMLASIRQVSENTDSLSSSAEQTSAAITEMSASVKEVEHRALQSAQLAGKVSQDASQRGLAAAAEAIRGMDNIRSAVEATATVLNGLGRRSQEIGQILKVIDDVTDQTGLLALNAAILAAQAGEHGKGFAVVAEEIKDLAERTASSTQEISGLIMAVQKETDETLAAMKRGLTAVEGGAELVRVTRDVLEQVADSSRQAADMAGAIERSTAEQARGIAQITEASVSITHQIDQIALAMKEQHRGSEQIAKAAERMRDITHRVKYATEEQTTGSKQIAQSVEAVTSRAAQVARATAEQRQGAVHIADAVAKIQQITTESVDLSIELEMAMGALRERAAVLQGELEKFRF